MKAMKFRVKDEQHSKEIQEALFAAGYGWGGRKTTAVENEEKPFLYAEKDGYILYSDEYSAETFFNRQPNEETVLFMGSFVSANAAVRLLAPAEKKPLVRTRKQFLQERQVELLRAMLADAEEGKMISDDYASELAENHQILESLT